jgi:hypothetical protein
MRFSIPLAILACVGLTAVYLADPEGSALHAASATVGSALHASSATLYAQAAQAAAPAAKPAPAPKRSLAAPWNGSPNPGLEPYAPMTPAGQALFDSAKPFWGPRSVPVAESNDPLIFCDPLGFPRNVMHETRGMEFVHAPEKTVQLFQYQRVWREIWTDGRPLPTDVGGSSPTSADPRRYGYSVGRWEDDYTFVVDTVGVPETGWGDEYGHPHGLTGRVEERYHRVDNDTLEETVTINDPEMYTRPFVVVKQTLKRGAKPLDEQLCVPSDAQNYLEAVGRPAAGRK